MADKKRQRTIATILLNKQRMDVSAVRWIVSGLQYGGFLSVRSRSDNGSRLTRQELWNFLCSEDEPP
jgi:hypothetical protein